MTTDEVRALIEETRRLRGELATVEAKSAAGGLPVRPVRETMSAFANGGGGAILLRVDEDAGYAVVSVPDPGRLQREISDLAAEFEPPLRPEIMVAAFDHRPVVAVEIDEVPSAAKPCFYRPSGLPAGAFVRVGPSNRRMTEYEVQNHLGGRSQPTFDIEPIADASLDDLDRPKLDAYLARLVTVRPRAAAVDLPFAQRLAQLGIARQIDAVYRPTLAGLLTFGRPPHASSYRHQGKGSRICPRAWLNLQRRVPVVAPCVAAASIRDPFGTQRAKRACRGRAGTLDHLPACRPEHTGMTASGNAASMTAMTSPMPTL